MFNNQKVRVFLWKKNLQKADFIELNNRQNIKDMTYEEIVRHSRKIKICNLIYLSIQGLLNLNRTISKIGIYINKKYPQLYYFLKSNINKIRKIQDEKEYINNPCG